MIKEKLDIYVCYTFILIYLNLFLSICYTCYLYRKLRVFLEREKTCPKKLKWVILFIYCIDRLIGFCRGMH